MNKPYAFKHIYQGYFLTTFVANYISEKRLLLFQGFKITS